MNVYLARHGETDWNIDKRFQGQTDIPLNDYGRELARKTRDGLKDIEFDFVFSSPLVRASETASIILEGRDISITYDDRLKEMSFGEYEGYSTKDLPDVFETFFNDPENFKPDKGETYEMLCARTEDFVRNVLIPLSIDNPDANVLITAHGAANKAFLKLFKGIEIKDIWSGPFTKNCSVNLIEINGDSWELKWENKIYY